MKEDWQGPWRDTVAEAFVVVVLSVMTAAFAWYVTGG